MLTPIFRPLPDLHCQVFKASKVNSLRAVMKLNRKALGSICTALDPISSTEWEERIKS